MIRLTVEQLYALQKSIQRGGQVHAMVLPMNAMSTHRLIIAWAKGRSAEDSLYLSIWRNPKSWEEAIAQDQAGVDAPYDFINDEGSMEYTHTYPVTAPSVHVPADVYDEALRQITIKPEGINPTEFEYRVQRVIQGTAADSTHPKFGATHGE